MFKPLQSNPDDNIIIIRYSARVHAVIVIVLLNWNMSCCSLCRHMVHYIYRELYQAHYQTLKGIGVAFVPLGYTNVLRASTWHSLQRCPHSVYVRLVQLAQVNHRQLLRCLQDDFVPATSCCLCLDSHQFIILFCVFFLPSFQSMVAFLKDPSGPPLWEENPEAKDVVHIETEKVSSDLNNLLSCVCNHCDDQRARKWLMWCSVHLSSPVLLISVWSWHSSISTSAAQSPPHT